MKFNLMNIFRYKNKKAFSDDFINGILTAFGPEDTSDFYDSESHILTKNNRKDYYFIADKEYGPYSFIYTPAIKDETHFQFVFKKQYKTNNSDNNELYYNLDGIEYGPFNTINFYPEYDKNQNPKFKIVTPQKNKLKITDFDYSNNNHLFIITFGNINQNIIQNNIPGNKITITDYKIFNHSKIEHSDSFLLISDSSHVQEIDVFIKNRIFFGDIKILPLIPENCKLETGAINYNKHNFIKLFSTLSKFLYTTKLSPLGSDEAFNEFQYEQKNIYVAQKRWNLPIRFLTQKPGKKINNIWIFHDGNFKGTVKEFNKEINSIKKKLTADNINPCILEGACEKGRLLIFTN